ncbi:MAG: hypothetical protein Q9M22_07700 [Mariprofundaceae bacterium]|nr:hypothetical protein [Mariprofundaceae bacterium]
MRRSSEFVECSAACIAQDMLTETDVENALADMEQVTVCHDE